MQQAGEGQTSNKHRLLLYTLAEGRVSVGASPPPTHTRSNPDPGMHQPFCSPVPLVCPPPRPLGRITFPGPAPQARPRTTGVRLGFLSLPPLAGFSSLALFFFLRPFFLPYPSTSGQVRVTRCGVCQPVRPCTCPALWGVSGQFLTQLLSQQKTLP